MAKGERRRARVALQQARADITLLLAKRPGSSGSVMLSFDRSFDRRHASMCKRHLVMLLVTANEGQDGGLSAVEKKREVGFKACNSAMRELMKASTCSLLWEVQHG